MSHSARTLVARCGALALGLALAAIPFLQFGTGGGHRHAPGPHADHAPARGGVLQMVGDHHVEIVATETDLRAFVSDARRRPLRATSAIVRFDSEPRAMRWERDHFVVAAAPDRLAAELTVTLRSGAKLRVPVPSAGSSRSDPGRARR